MEDLQDQVEEKSTKAYRKRMKGTYSKIRNQMEFYFSSANLSRDRFLKKLIDQSEDGFIPLQVFTTFNKIAAITKDVSVIAKSLKRSQLVKVNEDRTKAKRSMPLEDRQDVDERTVYVEYLPKQADHDWVKKVFSDYGEVAYVSIPRYKTTGDIKGFAFVEFQTTQAAKLACQGMNNPPTGTSLKPGSFPKYHKEITRLERQLDQEGYGHETEAMVPGEGTGKANTDNNSSDQSKKNTHKRKLSKETGPSTSEVDVSPANGNGEVKSKKRVKIKDEGKIVKTGQLNDKVCTENKLVRTGKGKRKAELGEGMSEKKVKVEEENDNKKEGKEVRVVDGTSRTSDVGLETAKKKRRKKKKKPHKEKESVPALRVISKGEWLSLKKEYLQLQKESMQRLKMSLLNIKKEERQSNDSKEKQIKPCLEFTPDVIVQVISERPTNRRDIKDQLSGWAEVAYIDFKDGMDSGHVRCSSSSEAHKLTQSKVPGLSFSILRGESETTYWNKLTSDREAKLSSKKKSKKRGSDKIIGKAEKHGIDMSKKKHIHFEDD